MKLQGIGGSPGIAVGKALVLESEETTIFRVPIEPDQVEAEVARFLAARDAAREQLEAIGRRVSTSLGESYAQIFDAHLLILDDRSLTGETVKTIREEKVNAEWALREVVHRLLGFFAEMQDPYLKERGGDIEDVHARLQQLLAGRHGQHDLSELTEDTIIVAHSLSPSDAAGLHHKRIVGLAIDVGGKTSHTAILAQARGIPAVLALHDFTQHVRGGDTILLDGDTGTVEIAPAPESIAASADKRAALVVRDTAMLAEKGLPAVTEDGVAVSLLANIEFPDEMPLAMRNGAAGVGLYRSEFLYLMRSPDLPTEAEHLEAYREILRGAEGRETVVRTLDLGGEKYFHTVLDREGTNPVLGLRAIRFCLKRSDIFKTQLRGLLRASVEPNLRVMLPLISGVAELRMAKGILDQARAELTAEGVPFNPDLDLGIMIEVPSAAVTADLLAKEVRFFSIGTNDLIQYALAIDRGNESVAYLYQPFHPAVLRLIRSVVEAANRAGIDVSICGEMAAEPVATPILVGLGLRKLSMTATAIPFVRRMVRRIDAGEAEALVAELVDMPSGEEVERTLERWLRDRELDATRLNEAPRQQARGSAAP